MSYRTKHHPTAGFTLIELLIVVGITAVVMITISTVFMTFLLSSSKTEVRRQVSAEGNEAIRAIEFEIRNARQVAGCSPSSGSLNLETSDGNVIIDVGSDKLRIDGQVVTSETSVTTLNFECTSNGGVQSVVTTLGLRPEGTSLTPTQFKATTQVRNTQFN